MKPSDVLAEAIRILKDGTDPDDQDEMEEALIDVLEATLQVKIWEDEGHITPSGRCVCDQCTSAIRLAQAILKET